MKKLVVCLIIILLVVVSAVGIPDYSKMISVIEQGWIGAGAMKQYYKVVMDGATGSQYLALGGGIIRLDRDEVKK